MPSTTRFARLVLSTSATLLLTAFPLDAIEISIQGAWSSTLDALDLSAGAGSDLIAILESDPDQGVVSITGATGSWRVDVRKSDAVWNNAIHLAVRRTSDGNGSGSISGGTSYLEVGAFDTTLFSGDADRADIDMQARLSGMSAGLGVSGFSTTLTYTVVDE